MRTEALILRSVDFRESDRIVHLLVPEAGRLTAIARGARRSRKRFAGTLDFFNHLRVDYERHRSATMARLEQATLIRTFPALRRDPARFGMGCYLLELLDRLAPEGAAPRDARRLFDFALGALDAIARRSVDPCSRTLLELRALDALGLRPELRRCVRCGREAAGAPGPVAFHVADGGALCARCGPEAQGALPVTRGTLRALEQGLSFDLDRLDRLRLSAAAVVEARRILHRFQRFHVGVELRSEAFLDRVLTSP